MEGSLPKQLFSAWKKVVRLSLPNGGLPAVLSSATRTATSVVPTPIAQLVGAEASQAVAA